MKPGVLLLCCGLAASCRFAAAREISLPPAPPPVRPDTESVADAPLPRSVMQRARLFRAEISLYATPSNDVEVAFGTSRRGDGTLAAGDETFSLGWENGAWFLASPTNRVRSAAFDLPAERTLVLDLRVRKDGSPVSLAVSDAAAGGLFPGVTNAPPDWLFSREWDAVRLDVRGTDGRNESLSVRLDADAGVLVVL